MLENIDVVTKVAERSSNLKGTFVKELKASSNKLRAAAVVVGKKTADSTNAALEEETVRLRGRVRTLEEQVGRLTALLHKEREERVKREAARGPEETMEVEMPEEHPAQARTQSPVKLAKNERSMRSKAQTDRQRAEKAGKSESAQASENPVYRPTIRGERRLIEEPPLDEAMEGVKRIMEGLSMKEIVNGNPQEVRGKLENLVIRCQGALSRIPRENKSGRGSDGRSLPSITKVEVVKDRVRVRARETAAKIIRDSKTPKEQAHNPPSTSWVEVVRKGKGKKKPATDNKPPATRPAKPEAAALEKGRKKATYAEAAKMRSSDKGGKANQPTTMGSGKGEKQPQRTDTKAVKPSAVQGVKTQVPAPKKRRTPRSEAVSVSFPVGEGAQGMRDIRSKVDLEALGIGPLKQRRALTGALIFEISGPESATKADTLANKMREAVAGKEGVRISRPMKMAEIRVKDIDESITQEEITQAIARMGGCDQGDIKVGQPRRAPNGLATVWAQCPVAAATKAASERRIRVGWASLRVEMLDARPLVCFRCLERGHVREQCRNPVDRSALCYRCGKEGHKAQTCGESLNCPVCSARGLPAGHKAGGAACPPVSRKAAKKARGTGGQKPKEASKKARGKVDETQVMETEPLAEVQGTESSVNRGGEGQEEAGTALPSLR
ncbi:PREDICTED: uncharacterized protein LOC105571164 [Vollenhovia emeryi]|uniref:uncharacterized protein LOC105571164 n=1 Tax=Vollenhovia emeryi TaxID=411798 RepID=UPI0005F3F829|nr:PREDICTED: uncharacterized protein LOC105571164 [Vollenhovia emeryi]